MGTNGIGTGEVCANPTCQPLSEDDIKNLDEPASNLSWDASIWNAGSGSFPCLNAITFGRRGCPDGGSPPNAREPGTPNLMLANGGVARQLVVTWNAPPDNFSPIIEYQLQYRENGITAWTDAVGPITSPYTITGLNDGTTYNIQLRAVNRIGPSPWVMMDGTTLGAPDAPNLTTLTITGVGELTATWSAPANNGGSAITEYRVDWGAGNMNVAAGVISYVITSLANGTDYAVQVSAINAIGTGTASNTRNATTATIPDAPNLTALTTTGVGELTATWSAPANNGGSAITGYRVDWGAGNMNVAAGVTSYVITSLANGTDYTVQVNAINVIGTGTASNTRDATTVTIPDAPNLTALTTTGVGELTATWSAPANNGGSAITGYRVDWGVGNMNVAAGVTSYAITSLTNGTSYTVQVSAINAIGTGTASNTRNATAATTPQAPNLTDLVIDGPRGLRATWSAPTNNGGSAITGYRVDWGVGNMNVAAGVTSYVITNLANGTSYTVQVSAINAIGTGTTSNIRNATTATTPDIPNLVNLTSPRDGQFRATWSAPANDGGLPITGYRITWERTGWPSSNRNVGVVTNSVISVIGGTYVVRVRAINAVGVGAFSNSRTRTISEER